jgi:hypothetical protein
MYKRTKEIEVKMGCRDMWVWTNKSSDTNMKKEKKLHKSALDNKALEIQPSDAAARPDLAF